MRPKSVPKSLTKQVKLLTLIIPKSWNLIDGDALQRKPRLATSRLNECRKRRLESFKKSQKKKLGRKKK